jgi:hypothetical protein
MMVLLLLLMVVRCCQAWAAFVLLVLSILALVCLLKSLRMTLKRVLVVWEGLILAGARLDDMDWD